ncbi:hypothetical protein [Natranaerofaba carboxydovora]|uniref:hypothetical protein n=1 Tax=Natranaerofaba carboxydovora TaxID=2742683 RepID=UPI001F12BF92|nr:hypothetical protein [Natranaerofaba carboxydovora]UMZ72532.1 hypothetical protein ACONDI_00052 [Natranaerofaba carboxydovora]
MAQVNYIREMYYEKGMSYAEISRATGHDAKTIKKYINKANFNTPPKPPKKLGSKLDPYKEEIDTWLKADKHERRKQRHTAKRIYNRLKDIYAEEFDCSYRLVAAYVKERKLKIYNGEGDFYLPLQHIPGESQVDFGQADFYERGIRHMWEENDIVLLSVCRKEKNKTPKRDIKAKNRMNDWIKHGHERQKDL